MTPERRRVWRLRFRDLCAASAFAAVGLSGTLPWWVGAFFLLALIASQLGVRPLQSQDALAVLTLLVGAVVFFGLAFLGTFDLVVAAVSFACLVAAQRMLSKPTPSTEQQVLLTSLLLMAGAAALSGEAWYAPCLLTFGVAGCLTMSLAVLDGPAGVPDDLPLGPALRQLSAGVALALLGGVVFFVTFPRLSWNVAAQRASPGLGGAVAGMADRIRLGGSGDIKTNSRIVARVQIDPDPGVARLEHYWVGRHFDVFDGHEWTGAGSPRPPKMQVSLSDLRDKRQIQHIELLPSYGASTLLALDTPVLFQRAFELGRSSKTASALVEVEGEEVRFARPGLAHSYEAWSRPTAPDVKDHLDRARSLQLPATLDPRIAELAKRIAGDTSDLLAMSHRIERWLRSNLTYSLELPGDTDAPLSNFLFTRRKGHCEHFATALAVMLRLQGVPARVTAGFFGGERLGDRVVVRAGEAHAWVEAYFDDRGWVALDATPPSGRGSQEAFWLFAVVDLWQRLEEAWRSRVVDYSFVDQASFVRSIVRRPSERGQAKSPISWSRDTLKPLALGLLLTITSWGAWRLTTRLNRRRLHPATEFLLDVERRLRQLGIALRDDEVLEETARRLEQEAHPIAGTLTIIARRYVEARFGHRPLGSTERQKLLLSLTVPQGSRSSVSPC
jgi:transglutaminase-like putative cysteine protease